MAFPSRIRMRGTISRRGQEKTRKRTRKVHSQRLRPHRKLMNRLLQQLILQSRLTRQTLLLMWSKHSQQLLLQLRSQTLTLMTGRTLLTTLLRRSQIRRNARIYQLPRERAKSSLQTKKRRKKRSQAMSEEAQQAAKSPRSRQKTELPPVAQLSTTCRVAKLPQLAEHVSSSSSSSARGARTRLRQQSCAAPLSASWATSIPARL